MPQATKTTILKKPTTADVNYITFHGDLTNPDLVTVYVNATLNANDGIERAITIDSTTTTIDPEGNTVTELTLTYTDTKRLVPGFIVEQASSRDDIVAVVDNGGNSFTCRMRNLVAGFVIGAASVEVPIDTRQVGVTIPVSAVPALNGILTALNSAVIPKLVEHVELTQELVFV